MNLEIDGETVEQVKFDYAISILASNHSEIRIESLLSVRSPTGPLVTVNPEHVGASAELMVSFLHTTIVRCEALETGELTLDFDNGARITVDVDADYEAWTFRAPDGRIAVARPGGGLTTWDRRPTTP